MFFIFNKRRSNVFSCRQIHGKRVYHMDGLEMMAVKQVPTRKRKEMEKKRWTTDRSDDLPTEFVLICKADLGSLILKSSKYSARFIMIPMSSMGKGKSVAISPEAKPRNKGLRYMLPNNQLVTFEMVCEAQRSLGYSDCYDEQGCCGAVVNFEDITKEYSLECSRFKRSLMGWLDLNTIEKNGVRIKKGRHCSEHRVGQDNLEPSQDAKKNIRAIICAYLEVYKSRSYHGSLGDPDNYLISIVDNPDHLSILGKKAVVRFRFKNLSERVSTGNLRQEQNNDRRCMRDVIFGEILEANHEIYNREWQDLHGELMNFNHGWERIANHVCLWHWKERFDFFSKLSTWGHYGNDEKKWHNHTRKGELRGLFERRLPQYQGWCDRILGGPVDSPVWKFFSESKDIYDNSAFDLIRFIRNLYEHITERYKDRSREYKYINDHLSWAEEKTVEHEVTQLFPDLLLDITRVLSSVYYIKI